MVEITGLREAWKSAIAGKLEPSLFGRKPDKQVALRCLFCRKNGLFAEWASLGGGSRDRPGNRDPLVTATHCWSLDPLLTGDTGKIVVEAGQSELAWQACLIPAGNGLAATTAQSFARDR
jgi:hypothetical protein